MTERCTPAEIKLASKSEPLVLPRVNQTRRLGGIRRRIGATTLAVLTALAPGSVLGQDSQGSFPEGNLAHEPLATLENSDPIVTVVEVESEDYNAYDAVKKYYESRPADLDVLILFNNFGPVSQSGGPFKNETEGIGREIYDLPDILSGVERLRTIGFMGNINEYETPTFKGLLEEGFLHGWGIWIGDIQDSGDPLPVQNTLSPGHWSPCMSFPDQDITTNPYYKARLWNQNPDGKWTRVWEDINKPNKFDTFSLYLMGLLPPEQVRPAMLLDPIGENKVQQCLDSSYDNTPLVATPQEITINDVINREGPRIPDYKSTQKDLRVGYVLVTLSGTQPAPGAVEKIEGWARDFIPYFHNAVTLNDYQAPSENPN